MENNELLERQIDNFMNTLQDDQLDMLTEIVMRPEDKNLRFDVQGMSKQSAVAIKLQLLIKG